MRKILVLILSLVMVCTFSLGTAFAAMGGNVYSHSDETIQNAVQTAVDSFPAEKYLKSDFASITNATNVLVAKADAETKYTAEVATAIAEFRLEATKVKTIAQQKEDLVKVKDAAKGRVAVKALEYKTKQLEALKADTAANVIKRNELDANIAKLTAYYNARIDAVEIVDKWTSPDDDEVGLAAATAKINGFDSTTFTMPDYTLDKLAKVPELTKYANTVADVKKNTFDTIGGKATFNPATVDKKLAEVVKKIETLDIDTTAKIDAEFAKVKTVTEESKLSLADAQKAAVAEITTGEFAYTAYETADQAAILKIQNDYTAFIWKASSVELVDLYVAQAKLAMGQYKTVAAKLAEEQKAKADAEQVALTEAEKAANAEYVAKVEAGVSDVKVTVRTAKVKAGTKVTVKSVTGMPEDCTVLYYNFYRTSGKTYVAKLSKPAPKNYYTNTSGKTGTKYKYKATVTFKDKLGNIYTTELNQCKAGIRVFK